MSMTVAELTRPLPPFHLKALKYAAARLLLTTVGRLSRGIEIGCTHGFDSGVMLDHVYDDRPQGRFLIGRLIDRCYLNAPGWTGIRARGGLLREAIVAQIEALAARKSGPPCLVDLACGGGRYGIAAICALKDKGIAVEAILRDYREENLEKAREHARQAGVSARIEQADAFSDAALGRLPAPDLVVVSGLHEIILEDEPVCRHFRQIAQLLPPGGRLIVTVQPEHPQLELIARVLTTHTGRPWAMRLRPTALIRAWATAAGFRVDSLTMEPQGIFGVLVAVRV